MIWVWSLLAIAISLVLFKIKKIKFYHYIWLLLPIDYYGIQIGGFTIKPYMVFFVFLIVFTLIKNKRVFLDKENNIIFLFFFIFLICDIGCGIIFESISQHIFFLLFFCFSLVYSSYCKHDNKKDVLNAIICSSIGFGFVNLLAIVVYLANIEIPGLYSETESVIRTYISMDVPSHRLCGFEGDPNAFCIFYIVAFVTGSCMFFHSKKDLYFIIPSIILSLVSIFFSKSRAALLLSVLAFLILAAIRLKSMIEQKRYIVITCLALLIAGFFIFFIIKSDIVIKLFMEATDSENRAGLFDTFGRATIWAENFKNMLIINPVFGVGSNQSYLYSSVARACHNTWVEFFCSLGLIFGPIVVVVFLCPIFWKYSNYESNTIKIAFIFLVLLLITIDYIANIYLLIIFAILFKNKEQHRNKEYRKSREQQAFSFIQI